MKAYTDLEQNQKLVEILPHESADMYYHNRIDIPDNFPLPIEWKRGLPLLSQEIPCWSLAALIRALPKNLDIGRPVLATNYRGYYWIEYFDEYMKETNLTSKIFKNPIDACYEMILKLHEQNLL